MCIWTFEKILIFLSAKPIIIANGKLGCVSVSKIFFEDKHLNNCLPWLLFSSQFLFPSNLKREASFSFQRRMIIYQFSNSKEVKWSYWVFIRSEKLKVVLFLINMSFCWIDAINWWFSVYSENYCLGVDYYLLHLAFCDCICAVFIAGKVEYGNYENYRYTLGIKFKEQILLTILENKMFLYRY